jgi:hypothetical protein
MFNQIKKVRSDMLNFGKIVLLPLCTILLLFAAPAVLAETGEQTVQCHCMHGGKCVCGENCKCGASAAGGECKCKECDGACKCTAQGGCNCVAASEKCAGVCRKE